MFDLNLKICPKSAAIPLDTGHKLNAHKTFKLDSVLRWQLLHAIKLLAIASDENSKTFYWLWTDRCIMSFKNQYFCWFNVNIEKRAGIDSQVSQVLGLNKEEDKENSKSFRNLIYSFWSFQLRAHQAQP